ncbi:MAG: hypothetical protein EBV82_01450, partial [Chitinophagia bacterium]|nr:hypothetical protein [Chitinophagia bacterium]
MKSSLTYTQLKDAAIQYGSPLYVYHAEKIVEQYQNLLTHFNPATTQFFYACKALTNIHVLKVIQKAGCNIDCSSINEVKLALHVGFNPCTSGSSNMRSGFYKSWETMPVEPRDDKEISRILVVNAHPDDADFGVGG